MRRLHRITIRTVCYAMADDSDDAVVRISEDDRFLGHPEYSIELVKSSDPIPASEFNYGAYDMNGLEPVISNLAMVWPSGDGEGNEKLFKVEKE